jgi:hypothetical protein
MSYHHIPHHISPLKNNSKESRKNVLNPLRVINGKFSQHASMPRQFSPLKKILKTLENIFSN